MFYFTTRNLLNLKRKQTQTTQSACCKHRSLFHKQKNTAPLSYDAVVKNQSAARIPRQQTRAPGDGWVTQRAPWRGVVGYRCRGLMGWRWGARSCAEAAAAGGICASLSVWKKTYRGIRAREIRDVDRPVCTSGPGQANVGRKATVSRRVLRTHSMLRNLNLILFFWRWAKQARLTYATRCPTDVLRSAAPWRWTFFDTVAGCVASLRPGSPLSVTGASSEWTSPVP
jgi:hypothetical protein